MRPLTPPLAIQKPEANDAKALALEPLCIDIEMLAQLTTLSKRHLRRLDSSGDIPGRIRSGKCVRFRLADIRLWAHHGMPNKARWAMLERTGQLRGVN